MVNRKLQTVFCDFLEVVGIDRRGEDFYESKHHKYELLEDEDGVFERDIFDNGYFKIRAYYWGDDDVITDLPNFEIPSLDFKMQWYKYPLRSAYMNMDISNELLLHLINLCKDLLKEENYEKIN
jgi:hypothetical protein